MYNIATRLLVLGLAGSILGLGACSTADNVDQKIAENNARIEARYQQKLEDVTSQLEQLQRENKDLEAKSIQALQEARDALKRSQEAGVLTHRKAVFEQSFTSSEIRFATGQAVLSNEAQALLDDFAVKLKTVNDSYYLEIQGHTDPTEPNPDVLGSRRADAVRFYLSRHHRIPLQLMDTISYGATAPVVPNRTPAGRAQNRRALVAVLEGGETPAFRGAQLPLFPWPPPKASGTEVLSNDVVAPRADTTLGDVAATLERALATAGYPQGSYFAVPAGFALVARLEHINADGATRPDSERWLPLDAVPAIDFTVSGYLKALLTARPGYYRVIAFVVTPLSFNQSTVSVTPKDAALWTTTGANRLPSSVKLATFKQATYNCTALVYEFERQAQDDPVIVRIPGNILPRVHLQKAGILAALGTR